MLKKAWRTLLTVLGVVENPPYPVAVERSVYEQAGKKRLVIYRLSDGNFCYQEELYNDKMLDMRWEPKGLSPGYPTAAEADAAARKALSWLWTVQE